MRPSGFWARTRRRYQWVSGRSLQSCHSGCHKSGVYSRVIRQLPWGLKYVGNISIFSLFKWKRSRVFIHDNQDRMPQDAQAAHAATHLQWTRLLKSAITGGRLTTGRETRSWKGVCMVDDQEQVYTSSQWTKFSMTGSWFVTHSMMVTNVYCYLFWKSAKWWAIHYNQPRHI